MMTEPNRSLDELPALIAERKKFESWISALEGRREATAPHVFERVRGDYLARLHEVEDRLAAHRNTILEEKTSLESRRSLLEAEEQLRRDERAELELRAHVGELAGEDSESAFATVDEALARMSEERDGLSKRIEELDGFLTLPSRGDESDAAAPGAGSGQAGVTPVDSTPVDSTAVDSTAVDSTAQATDRPATPVDSPAASATPAAASTVVDADKLVLSEHSATFQRTTGQVASIDEALTEPPGAGKGGDPGVPPGARLTPGGSFDELAFLSNVVGLKADADGAAGPATASPGAQPGQTTQSATPLRTEPPKSPLDGMAGGRQPMATPPLASNVGNTPIVLRASGAISQSKTLKCTECGAMNYPTEWYCERCGAELAAL
jgi:hypothetical protein